MGHSLHIGPFTLPWAIIITLVAWQVASFIGQRLAVRRGMSLAPHGWLAPLIALLAARLAFVAQYAPEYAAQPLSIIDIRDGGWEPIAAFVALVLYALFLWIRESTHAKAVTAGVGAHAVLWLAGMGALHMFVPSNTALPSFQAVALDAQTVNLESLKGQPVVVNIWATWCPPCRREMPALQAAQAQHPDVRFLYVNQGEAPDVVLRYISQIGLAQSDVLLDTDQKLTRMINERALPTTLFFNADGQQTAMRVGELSHATLAQHLGQIAAGNTQQR